VAASESASPESSRRAGPRGGCPPGGTRQLPVSLFVQIVAPLLRCPIECAPGPAGCTARACDFKFWRQAARRRQPGNVKKWATDKMIFGLKSFSCANIGLVWFLCRLTYCWTMIEPLRLSLPGDVGKIGELNGPTAVVCYNLSLSDPVLRQVVWWDRGRLSLRVEPCLGKPHMKVSVYGCPSDGARVVWEYMNAPMKSMTVNKECAVRCTFAFYCLP
jgi:hypothetical protein